MWRSSVASSRVWPFVAFFLSGASSLVFQTIWSRLLHHVFGSSSVAISSVVSVFMGGLALGAFLAGKVVDRLKRPLLAYAVAELLVAGFGLLVPVLLDPEGPLALLNATLRARLGEASFAFAAARFVAIVPVLLVPTTLMGATLPLLARHFIRRDESQASASARASALYATNTAGAVFGVMLAGFVLLPSVGVSATHTIALSCNAFLFLLAGTLALRAPALTRTPHAQDVADAPGPPQPSVSSSRPPVLVRRLATAAFTVSGFCALLYEVVWSRALVSTIGASAYAFALILATFLLGIAGGSAVGLAMLERRSADANAGPSGPARGLFSEGLLPAALLACAPSVLDGVARRTSHAVWLAMVLVGATVLIAQLVRARDARARALDAMQSAPQLAAPGREALAVLMVFAPALLWALGNLLVHADRLARLSCTLALLMAALFSGLYLTAGRVLVQLAFTQLFIALATLVSTRWADQISLTFASLVSPLYDQLADHVDHVIVLMFAMASLCVLPSALGMGAMFPLALRAVSGGGAEVGREVSVLYARNTVGSIAGAWLPGFLLMPTLGMQATLHVGIAIGAGVSLVLFGAAILAPRSAEALGARRRVRIGTWLGASAAACVIALMVASLTSPFVRRALAWDLTRMTLGVFRIALAKSALDQEAWGEPDILYYRDGLSTTVSVERWGRHVSLKNNGKVEASNGDDMATQINVAALPLLFHARGAQDLDVAIIGFGSGVTVGAALQFPVRSVDVMELERAVVDASRFYSDVNHLDYPLAGFPYVQAPRLRTLSDDGRNYLASTTARYDVIISEPSNPWLTGVSDLFTADHFRIAKRVLRKGGVYGQWVQLYELSPDNVKIIYRTFAEHFRYVLAFSADDLSSDTVLLGSDEPLPLDIAHLARGMRDERVAAELRRARVPSPYSVIGRVLFSGRDEVMRYAVIEQRAATPGAPLLPEPEATGALPCPAATCRRTLAPLNTDDNALIELSAPRDLIGFERYKGYLGTVYGASWPYGALADRLRGLGTGQQADAHRAEVALALLAHGRKREASAVLERVRHAGQLDAAPSRVAVARAVLEVLTSPEPLDGSGPALEPPALVPDPTLSERSQARLLEGQREVLDWLQRGDGERAHRAARALPDTLVRHVGADALLLRGVAAYRAQRFSEAITDLETALRIDGTAAQRWPQAQYVLARAHDSLAHFGKAVGYAEAWVGWAVPTREPL